MVTFKLDQVRVEAGSGPELEEEESLEEEGKGPRSSSPRARPIKTPSMTYQTVESQRPGALDVPSTASAAKLVSESVAVESHRIWAVGSGRAEM